MIQPINGHILIKPLTHDSFMQSQRETYEEVGTILAIDEFLTTPQPLSLGDKVYFDSWLAAKFPSDDPENPYWMVKYEDIRAIEHVKPE